MSGEQTACGCVPGRLWDTRTVAQRLGLSPVLVRHLVTHRAIPHVRHGDRIGYRPNEIDAWAALCGHQLHPIPPATSGPDDDDGGRLAPVVDLDHYRKRRRP